MGQIVHLRTSGVRRQLSIQEGLSARFSVAEMYCNTIRKITPVGIVTPRCVLIHFGQFDA